MEFKQQYKTWLLDDNNSPLSNFLGSSSIPSCATFITLGIIEARANRRLSKTHTALHAHDVGLGVRMQTHHFNQRWSSTSFWVHRAE